MLLSSHRMSRTEAVAYTVNGCISRSRSSPKDWSTSAQVRTTDTCLLYTSAMRTPLIRGRFFDQSDGPDAPSVVIINQTMARTFWPNQDAIGKRLKFGGAQSRTPWSQIVGIVADVRQVDLSIPPGPEMYFTHWQALGNYMTPHALVVEMESSPMGLADGFRHAVQSVDAEQPADDIFPLDDLIDTDVAPRRMQAALIGSLALLALVIASVGIYGVMAYLVSQRTQEMGIRMALGAQRRSVVMLVLSRGAKIALLGVGIGITAAAGLTRLMRSLLFEVSPADPFVLVGMGTPVSYTHLDVYKRQTFQWLKYRIG